MATGCTPAASPSLYNMLYIYLVLSGFVLPENVRAYEICGNNLSCIARATSTTRIESFSHQTLELSLECLAWLNSACSALGPCPCKSATDLGGESVHRVVVNRYWSLSIFPSVINNHFGGIWSGGVAVNCRPSSIYQQICIADFANVNVIPRYRPYIMGDVNKNNGLIYIKHQRISELVIKRKWLEYRIPYYCNSTASFNFLALSIKLSGDAHPMPGPVSEVKSSQVKSTISVRVTNRRCYRPVLHCRDVKVNIITAQYLGRTSNSMRTIPVLTTNRTDYIQRKHVRFAEHRHLVRIQRNDNVKITTTGVRFSLLNVRSV